MPDASTRTAADLFAAPLPDRAERRRLRLLFLMLLRARWSPVMTRRLHRWICQHRHHPPRALPCTGMVLPLAVHHILMAGEDPGACFLALPGWPVPDDSELRRLAVVWSLRQRALRAFLGTLAEAGCQPPLLIKGEALAPLTESPVLRVMTDTDVILRTADVQKARRALHNKGFRITAANAANALTHESTGAVFDLLVPAGADGRRVLNRAASADHPAGPALVPLPEDHLLILASHARRHMGHRIWRDALDVRLLLRSVPDPVLTVAAAEETARQTPHLAETLAGLLHFTRRNMAPETPHPQTSAPDFLRELYHRMAFSPVPPTAWKLLRRLLPAVRADDQSTPRAAGLRWRSETDFGLGETPHGTADRFRLRLRLAGAAAFSPSARDAVRLARLQRLAERDAPRLFREAPL